MLHGWSVFLASFPRLQILRLPILLHLPSFLHFVGPFNNLNKLLLLYQSCNLFIPPPRLIVPSHSLFPHRRGSAPAYLADYCTRTSLVPGRSALRSAAHGDIQWRNLNRAGPRAKIYWLGPPSIIIIIRPQQLPQSDIP